MLKLIPFITRTDSEINLPSSANGKRKIFISYKHSDEQHLPICQKLISYILDKLDVAIWYDRQLIAGNEYDSEIQSIIRQSDALVLLLTPNILSSEYIIEHEIPFAIQNKIPIIPIVAGLSKENLLKAEKILGRIHMPIWFFGKKDSLPIFPTESLDQFQNGLILTLASKDILEQATLFYEKGMHNTSLRYLTSEEVFLKAYGCLFDIQKNSDKDLGVKLMTSILNCYGNDEDFIELQKKVSHELLKHLYSTNQADLFFIYLKSALEKRFESAFSFLFDIYQRQWHSDILSQMPELSFALFKHLYQKNFSCLWDSNKIVRDLEKRTPIQPKKIENPSDLPHIGEIICPGVTAFFQKDETTPRTVNLVVNGYQLSQYDVYASFGDVYLLFMAYDPDNKLLITLHSDFDHYGPETCIRGEIYLLEESSFRFHGFYSDWLRGLRRLPYGPPLFDIR